MLSSEDFIVILTNMLRPFVLRPLVVGRSLGSTNGRRQERYMNQLQHRKVKHAEGSRRER
eukprot:1860964-Pleurochrysis_carterae.AAC.1